MLARRLSPIVALAFAAAPRVLTAQAKEYLYVGNTLGGDLSIIAIPEHKVVGTIPATVVGNSPDDVISSRNGDVLYISRLERLLYVPLYDKGELVVVDTKTHAILKRIAVGASAHGTILGPTGKYVYVGLMEGNQLAQIDVATNTVKRVIHTPEGVRPFQLSPDETLIYAQLSKLHGFVVIDIARDSIIKTVQLPTLDGATPKPSLALSHWVVNHGLGLTNDGRYLVANASLSGFTAIYSVPDLKLVGTVPVGKEPNWVAFSHDGKYAYVSNRRDNTLSVISVADRKEVTRLKVGEFPQRMAVATTHRPQ
jgi:YVTN family beta-propeller protein